MNLQSASERREFFRLCGTLCDGQIEEADFQELQSTLIANELAQSLYLRYVDVHQGIMCWREREAGSRAWSLLLKVGGNVQTNERQDFFRLDSPGLKASLFRSFSSKVASIARSPMGSILLVASIFYGSFALLAWNLNSKPIAQSQTPDSWQATDEPPVPASMFAATLTAATDCVWQPNLDGSQMEVGYRCHANQMLVLQSGVAELTFLDGTKVALEGPSQFIVENERRGMLERGQLVAQVPKQAIGFTVATPTAKVIDLGTEFGVYVDQTGITETQVFRGQVEAISNRSTDAHGKPIRKVIGPGTAWRIPTDHGEVSPSNANSERFLAGRKLLHQKGDTKTQDPTSMVVLVSDDFNDNSLDKDLWTTTLPYSGSSIAETNGQVLQLTKRGYLNTAAEYKPADYNTGNYTGGLIIRGRVTFGSSTDNINIVTRSDGTPNLAHAGDVTNGIVFLVNREYNQLQVYRAVSGEFTKLVMRPIPLSTDTFDFVVNDDGLHLTFSIVEVGGDRETFTVTASDNTAFRTNKVSFFNRERDLTAYLNNIVIQTKSVEAHSNELKRLNP